MKKSAKSNMYESTLDDTWALFSHYLSGERTSLICVISENSLSSEAIKALQSSFAKLGYGNAACTFFTLRGTDQNACMPILDSQSLFNAIEGLDPMLLIITDKHAAKEIGHVYRQPISLNKRSRIFGRETRAFAAFEDLLTDGSKKQKAWALLKSLPTLHE